MVQVDSIGHRRLPSPGHVLYRSTGDHRFNLVVFGGRNGAEVLERIVIYFVAIERKGEFLRQIAEIANFPTRPGQVGDLFFRIENHPGGKNIIRFSIGMFQQKRLVLTGREL